MYEEPNESATAGTKLGQDRLRFGSVDPELELEPREACIDI